jgi:hypothetical protein
MKIHLVRAELFHADGQTVIHDDAISRFSQFCLRDEKWIYVSKARGRGLGYLAQGRFKCIVILNSVMNFQVS